MSATVRRCPVCRQIALPTKGSFVKRHRDSIGRDVCPMSNEDYELTEVGRQYDGPRTLRLVS